MHILDFLKCKGIDLSEKDAVTFEYRLLCSGELYNGDVETLDWRKSTASHLILTSPFLINAPIQSSVNYPQELALRFIFQSVTEERTKPFNISFTFYPDEEIAKDIAALLCIFFRRLVTVFAKVREIHPKQHENEPDFIRDWPVDFANSFKRIFWKLHPAMSTVFPNGVINIEDYNPRPKAISSEQLKKRFLAIPKIPYAESIIRSSKLYALALEQIYENPEISYLLLISSIEAISNEVYNSFRPSEADMIKTKRSTADLGVKLGLSEEHANQIAIESCKDNPWARRKFTKFLLENTGDDVWTEDELFKLPDVLVPKKQDFESIINSIYTIRSKATHSGGSYPVTAKFVTGPMIPARAMFDFLAPKGPFPPIAWFERVVNSAITGFIDRVINQSKG
jgi:hypothetical protein